jgi:peptide/nickel transport system permease protein
MLRYIFKRVLHATFIIWLVATAVFVGLRTMPGDPARLALGIQAPQEAVNALREQLGLNEPLHMQYIDYWANLLQLDLGRSIQNDQLVSEIMVTAAPKTLSIAAVAFVVGLTISIPAGLIAATKKNQFEDYLSTVGAFLGVSMPAFFFGILLSVIIGGWLDLLPTYGYTEPSEGVIPWLQSILLPGIAVGVPYAAIVMRMMRSSLLEELGQQYMQTAQAKGVPPRTALFKHALQNAMIPVVTVAGIQVAFLLTGSVTVELVFGIKGLGRVLIDAMLTNDYQVVQGAILLIAGIMVYMNLLVDIVYTFIDPRIRYD